MLLPTKGRVVDQQKQGYRNHLLRTLAPADLAALTPHLQPARLPFRRMVETPNQAIKQIFFPDSGIISVVATTTPGRQIEAGFIGFEGMSGIAVVMGDDRSPNETYVQVAGGGHAIDADDLRAIMRARSSIREVLLRYVQVFMIQTAHTALANGRSKIEERLARWLLMAHDRLEGAELPLTHELLSVMLGVRRPSVTDALHRLEGYRVIRARRGAITVLDRGHLQEMAGGSYGIPEDEYRRLLGGFAKANGRHRLTAGLTPRRSAFGDWLNS